MSSIAGTVFDANTPNIIRVSRIAGTIIVGMIFVLHGAILAI